MKKIIALCLVIVMCVSLVACGSKDVLSGEYASKDGRIRAVFVDDRTLTWYVEGLSCKATYEKTDEGWNLVLLLDNGNTATATMSETEDGAILVDDGYTSMRLYKK